MYQNNTVGNKYNNHAQNRSAIEEITRDYKNDKKARVWKTPV
jgi:hypothetical protein